MKRETLQQLAHLTAGIITLVYGFDTFESGEFLSALSYLSLAIIFLIVAGSHKWMIKKFIQADVALYVLEGATILFSAWNYKIQGNPYLFYAMVTAGMLFLIFAIITLIRGDRPKKRRPKRRRKRKRSSSLFKEQGLADDTNPLE